MSVSRDAGEGVHICPVPGPSPCPPCLCPDCGVWLVAGSPVAASADRSVTASPGYGDIIVPGFIVAYCAAMDKIHQIAHHAYLVTAATGNSRLTGQRLGPPVGR